MQAVTLQSVTKISPGHIAAMREFMKGVPNWRKQLNVRTASPVLVFQFETRAGIFLECTPKLRQEIKEPATVIGGERCWCPDKNIPVN
jgi:hypothetical protein